jgi:hypothetical protein
MWCGCILFEGGRKKREEEGGEREREGGGGKSEVGHVPLDVRND